MKSLQQTLNQAQEHGGSNIAHKSFRKVFGKDEAKGRNVLAAYKQPALVNAIEKGVINDHRVIESMRKVGPMAARIIVELEERLNRPLTRSRAQQLADVYVSVVREREQAASMTAALFKKIQSKTEATKVCHA